mmetsp:Transcript_31764/g.61192  ORF Transcript_31764/g.61192 Transcript_31764/m.61192 type:complete len:218 (-) Transcript_31764:942-1595(-)
MQKCVLPRAALVHPSSLQRLPPPCAMQWSVLPTADLEHPCAWQRLPPPWAMHRVVSPTAPTTEYLLHPSSTHMCEPLDGRAGPLPLGSAIFQLCKAPAGAWAGGGGAITGSPGRRGGGPSVAGIASASSRRPEAAEVEATEGEEAAVGAEMEGETRCRDGGAGQPGGGTGQYTGGPPPPEAGTYEAGIIMGTITGTMGARRLGACGGCRCWRGCSWA